MADKLAELIIIFKFIVPISIFILLFVGSIIYFIVSSFRYDHKVKWLESNGYERHVHSAASKYNGFRMTYEWRNDDTNKCILEDTLSRVSYKEMIKRCS